MHFTFKEIRSFARPLDFFKFKVQFSWFIIGYTYKNTSNLKWLGATHDSVLFSMPGRQQRELRGPADRSQEGSSEDQPQGQAKGEVPATSQRLKWEQEQLVHWSLKCIVFKHLPISMAGKEQGKTLTPWK